MSFGQTQGLVVSTNLNQKHKIVSCHTLFVIFDTAPLLGPRRTNDPALHTHVRTHHTRIHRVFNDCIFIKFEHLNDCSADAESPYSLVEYSHTAIFWILANPLSLMNEISTYIFQQDVLHLNNGAFCFQSQILAKQWHFIFCSRSPLKRILNLCSSSGKGWKGCGGFDRPTVTKKL